jgi:hypothetical protein
MNSREKTRLAVAIQTRPPSVLMCGWHHVGAVKRGAACEQERVFLRILGGISG